MLYFKYRKFIKIFKTLKKVNNLDHIEWRLEEKYGSIANEALSILRAKSVFVNVGLFHENVNYAKMDAIILEYEERCSSMFWGFLKWTIGTIIAIAGLCFAYLTFTK